ncbi:MAG: hypothetical protein HC849_26335 [Oscillatoriales cyanobacterium RU_3_3]|nr:hypothetical protein [Microcoleus sp. SU_5_6]NJL68301.1 hypothetical protein [Microcoleus sp. SM1_3_4]NJM62912.1 hypothetical protein [Oscillatoriales cyanobacterium RU_3_3]NJR25423.1 hypothetical protein [Richelia sp. CSU_2_1]
MRISNSLIVASIAAIAIELWWSQIKAFLREFSPTTLTIDISIAPAHKPAICCILR